MDFTHGCGGRTEKEGLAWTTVVEKMQPTKTRRKNESFLACLIGEMVGNYLILKEGVTVRGATAPEE
jgi:hypothetical protein